MRDFGFALTANTCGWATLGPLAAVRNIARLLGVMRRVARELAANPPDLVVLLDFGAFNVRFARALRKAGYNRPIFYGFPPAAWLDRVKAAKLVAELTTPVAPFSHQRDFYTSLGLPVQYFGHPIAATITARAGYVQSKHGRFVFLPGSRKQEIALNLPRMLAAITEVRRTLRDCEVVVVAADSQIEIDLRKCVPQDVRIERDARTWLAWADVACVASGTAVLESALLGVPTVAMYVLSQVNAAVARRVYRGRYVTIPNLVLDRMAIPELLQDAASAQALTEHLLALFHDASEQQRAMRELRAALESEGAMHKWAECALALAES